MEQIALKYLINSVCLSLRKSLRLFFLNKHLVNLFIFKCYFVVFISFDLMY